MAQTQPQRFTLTIGEPLISTLRQAVRNVWQLNHRQE